jgi:hypothetical protein
MMKSKFSTLTSLVLAALVIFGFSGWAWWHYVQSKPTKVFDRMLSTLLTAQSVTKTISQEENGQKLEQTIQLTLQPKAQVHSENVLDQGQAVITTESIGTLQNDFVRYLDIKTDQKNSSGSSFDFSNVLTVWGKSGDNKEAGEEAQLFNQTVLGVVPVANLPLGARQELLRQIRTDKVYTVNYGSVKRSNSNGRPVYTYDVTVEPVAYINMLKTFAHSLGLSQLDQVDASQYTNTPALKFSFDVDVWSAQLTKVTYTGSNRTETYSAYGARAVVNQPKDTITLEELQTRLQSIQ